MDDVERRTGTPRAVGASCRLVACIAFAVFLSSILPTVAAITVQPGVIFQPSQSWGNLSFASTQTFNTIVVDPTGVTFDGVRFGIQKFPNALPRVEITIGTWRPTQTTVNATSVRFSATSPTTSIVYFNFTYLLANREYFLQVDGVEQARKFTSASGQVSFPWSAWSTHDFNVFLGPRSGGPVNQCPAEPAIPGNPPLTTFVGSSVTFVGTSMDPDRDPLTWTWMWGDGLSSTLSTPPGTDQTTASHTWSTTGDYNVSLSVTDSICVVTSELFAVHVIPRPLRIGFIEGTVRDAATFAPLSGATIGVVPGGYGQATDVQGRYNVSVAAGSYTVNASATFYAPVSRLSIVVSENQTTVVDFILASESGNLTASFDFTIDGATVHFIDRSTSDGVLPITQHLWAFGDGTTGTGATPDHTYAISGLWSTYTVTLMACDPVPDHCAGVSKDLTLVNWPVLLAAIGLIAGLALVGVAVLFWYRRRPDEEEPVETPADEPEL